MGSEERSTCGRRRLTLANRLPALRPALRSMPRSSRPNASVDSFRCKRILQRVNPLDI